MAFPEDDGFARLLKSSEPDAEGGGMDTGPGASAEGALPCWFAEHKMLECVYLICWREREAPRRARSAAS